MNQHFNADQNLNLNCMEFNLDNLDLTDNIDEKSYVSLGRPKKLNDLPIVTAFTIPNNLLPVTISGVKLAWKRSAIATFAEILKAMQSKVKNLPYASLRGMLEIGLTQISRLDSKVSLDRYSIEKKSSNSVPFAYLTDTDLIEASKTIRSLLDLWIVQYLRPFAIEECGSDDLLKHLEDLWQQNELIDLTPFQSQVLPWIWDDKTGTTKNNDGYSFPLLADYVARLISGQEIFQGLGPMKRIIRSSGLSSGITELITNPITLSEGIFSLVVTIEIVTFPSIQQPLLTIDVSKRRWISHLNDPTFERNNIKGYVFSNDYTDRVFSFTTIAHKSKSKDSKKDNNKYLWQTDKDFEAIRTKLRLPIQVLDIQAIVLGQANINSCQFFLTYRHGIGEQHQIDAGVPELDKLEAFGSISKLLKSTGVEPFKGYEIVKAKHSLNNITSRMINLPTLMSAILESSVNRNRAGSSFTPNYLKSLDDSTIDRLLQDSFGFSLDLIKSGRKALYFDRESNNQIDELGILNQANQSALSNLHPDEKLRLIIFYESELQIEVKILQKLVTLLFGDSIEVLTNRIPANTHGNKEILPGIDSKQKERVKLRCEAWKPIAQQLDNWQGRNFCLIMAREFYPDLTQPEKVKHDDRINKPSTRQALAAMAGACVQFILPIQKLKSTQQLNLEDFFHRAQSALKDLLFAHSGRVDRVKEKVDRWLKDIPSKNRPREIISITIVRKQKGRVRGIIENTFLPIAIRLNVETGKSDMCCAYEKGNTLQISQWQDFPDAIGFISQISPIKLAKDKATRKTRFMEFVNQIISESVDNGTQPLVLIDSSNCVQLWPWLADVRIDANNINLEQQHQMMQENWQGARIIRIRQDLAPGAIEKTERQFIETTIEDTRSKLGIKKLAPDYRISCASSSSKLLRLASSNPTTNCITYLSTRSRTLHQNTRGVSCYRGTQTSKIQVNKETQKDLLNVAKSKVEKIEQQKIWTKQWPTPNPLEIVVTLRQPDDDPDMLAALVESFRFDIGHYSDWVSLPAPLFFERVVRDYISEFTIGNDDEAYS